MNKKLIQWFIFYIVIFTCWDISLAYHLNIHKRITEESIQQNIVIINEKLKNFIGLESVDELVNNKEIREWVKEGSWREDVGFDILTSHFYNPITNQGLNLGNQVVGESAYDRANNLNNAWSWKKAREYFYEGLTLISKTEREKALADSFRAIGQVMHLVQDMSVPAHTREDPHSYFEPYEKYTDDKTNTLNYILEPFPYWGQATSPNAPKQFWDSDLYDGSIPYISGNIGLAEYTNANFASIDTIFSETLDVSHPYYFTFPRKSSAVLYEEVNPQTNKKTKYFRIQQDSEIIEHFAVAGKLYSLFEGWPNFQRQFISLDDKCHEDYAQKLIPRAVGYSAGLLNYFFRGTLEVTMPDSYIYSITDGSLIPQQFTRLKAKVRNSTPDSIPGEEIQGCDAVRQNCILQAVARYKKRTDYQPDLSTDPPTASSRETDYSYSVSAPIVITSLSSTTPAEFTFDFTNSPIPAGITDLYLHVVFKGTIGSETDIAMAVGMKDLNEPQHFSIWNATDRFYLDGVLRTASEIRNDPLLLARVDFNGNGIANEAGEPYIDPYDVTTEVAFYPSGVTPTIYNATFTPLPSGRYGRIIILTDMPNFYTLIHRNSTNPPDDMTANFLFSGVTNQDNYGTFQNTQVITFRGIIQHTWSAYARNYPNATGISTAPWPVPSNINPHPASTLYP